MSEITDTKRLLAEDDAEEIQAPTVQSYGYYSAIRAAPLMALLGLGYGMCAPVTLELLKLRVCQKGLGYPDAICNNLDNASYATEGHLVQNSVAQYSLCSTLIASIPAIFFSVVLGSWSDDFGRKLPMLVPLVGVTLYSLVLLICAIFPVHPAIMLIPPALICITGGLTVSQMAIYSYVGDHTTNENRAINMAAVNGVLILVGNGGQVLGSYLMINVGITAPFYVVLGTLVVTFVYITLVIKDLHPRKAKLSHVFHPGTIFTMRRLTSYVDLLKKKRKNNNRKLIWLIMFSVLISGVSLNGDLPLLQVFLEFKPFFWNLEFFTMFSCIQGIAMAFTTSFGVLILSKAVGMNDATLAIISCLSAILNFYGLAIAKSDWMVYTASAVGVFKVVQMVSVNSLVTEMVDADEIGKVMSLVASLSTMTPLIGSAIFTEIFTATNSWWPGCCFAVGGFFVIPALAVFAYVDLSMRHKKREI